MSVQRKDFFGFEKMLAPTLIKIIDRMRLAAIVCAARVHLTATFAVLGKGRMNFGSRFATLIGVSIGMAFGAALTCCSGALGANW